MRGKYYINITRHVLYFHVTISLQVLCTKINRMHQACIMYLALPCFGPLAPRGAVWARHDGLPHQLCPLLPLCAMA